MGSNIVEYPPQQQSNNGDIWRFDDRGYVDYTHQGPCVDKRRQSSSNQQQPRMIPTISNGGMVTFYKQSYYIRPLEFEMDRFLNRGKVAFWVPKEKGDTINLFSLRGSSMLDSSLITKVTLYIGGHPLHTIDGWLLAKNFYSEYELPFINAPLYTFMMSEDQIVIEIEYIADTADDGNAGSFINPKDLRLKVQYGTLEPRVTQELKRNMDLGLGNQLITVVDQKRIQIIYKDNHMYWVYPKNNNRNVCDIMVNSPYGLKMHDPTENWPELEQHSKLPQPY